MTDRLTTLRKYVSDVHALERHILDAVRQQRSDDRLRNHPEAAEIVGNIERMLANHVQQLEGHLGNLGGDSFAPIKDAVSSALGTAAGIIDRVRGDNPVSKILRDDYSALSHDAISYTMLHTTGLALGSEATAELAVRHLMDITPLIVDISEQIPMVVARELSDDGSLVDRAAGEEAARNTQRAWRSDVVRQ